MLLAFGGDQGDFVCRASRSRCLRLDVRCRRSCPTCLPCSFSRARSIALWGAVLRRRKADRAFCPLRRAAAKTGEDVGVASSSSVRRSVALRGTAWPLSSAAGRKSATAAHITTDVLRPRASGGRNAVAKLFGCFRHRFVANARDLVSRAHIRGDHHDLGATSEALASAMAKPIRPGRGGCRCGERRRSAFTRYRRR